MGRQLVSYRPRALHTFPPSPSRWDANWSATARHTPHVSAEPVSVGRRLVSYARATPHVSTEPVSVGRQLVSYRPCALHTFPPSPSRWDANWSATARATPHVSARLGGTATGQLPLRTRTSSSWTRLVSYRRAATHFWTGRPRSGQLCCAELNSAKPGTTPMAPTHYSLLTTHYSLLWRCAVTRLASWCVSGALSSW